MVPDKWKEGASNTNESGGRKINENNLLSRKNRMDNHSSGYGQGIQDSNNLFVVPDGESVEPTQEHSNLFVDDEWAYRLAGAAPLQQLDPVEGNGTQMDSSTQQSNESPMAARKGKKVAKPKKVARRGRSFTKEEDNVICAAFLNVSKNPVTGVDQSSGGYYKRIHDYYNEHKPEGCHRSQIAIQHRWQVIQKSVNRFSGFKSAIDKRNESGKNEHDRIDDAVNMYEKTETFMFMHCWKLLRNEPKWNDRMSDLNTRDAPSKPPQHPQANSTEIPLVSGNDNCDPPRPEGRVRMLELNTRDAPSKPPQHSQANSTEIPLVSGNDNCDAPRPEGRVRMLELNTRDAPSKPPQHSQANSTEIPLVSGNDNCDPPRPEGRDSAKRRRSRGAGDASSSSTAVEVLERLNERSEKYEVKQDQQVEEILNLKRNKMKLGKMMYDLHKQDMEVRTKLKKEQLSLTKKDIEVREKQSEAQLLTSEVGIMGADLEKLAPQVKAYYVAMQRQIMERRGIKIPRNNNS